MNTWSKKIPTKPGIYWWYGQEYAGEKPSLCLVRGWQGNNEISFVREGHFFYPHNKSKNSGLWISAILPEIPCV